MSLPYDVTFAPCHVPLSNVASDGTIAIPANNTPVLVATVPLATGPMPLDSDKLYAIIHMSFDCVTNNGAHSFQRKPGTKIERCRGNAVLSSISIAAPSTVFNDDLGLLVETTSSSTYFDIDRSINGSGDLEIYLKGLSGGGVATTFRNLLVSYRIVGSK